VHPKLWEDPFENFILNSVILTPDGTKAKVGFRDHVFGQCWSLHRETDLMWRAYSPNKDAVKLKTTIGQLLNSLYAHAGKHPTISCFIGKVRYLAKVDIPEVFSRANILDSTGKGIAETLLAKRWAFRGEKEIRLIYLHNDNDPITDVFSYKIDPNALFSEAVLDPRMDQDAANKWTIRVKDAGYNGSLSQSDLYKPPENMVIHI
jgi:hypothetical protein